MMVLFRMSVFTDLIGADTDGAGGHAYSMSTSHALPIHLKIYQVVVIIVVEVVSSS